MIISRGVPAYEFAEHDSATSTGTGDVKEVMVPLPEGTYGTVISVESAAVRVTYDGQTPAPDHGIFLPPGVHFLPFAKDILFASASEEPAPISVVWLKGTTANETSA
jgi:hypothetical protein